MIYIYLEGKIMIKFGTTIITQQEKIKLNTYSQFNIKSEQLSDMQKAIIKFLKSIDLSLQRVFVIYYKKHGDQIQIIISGSVISSIKTKNQYGIVSIEGKHYKIRLQLITKCTIIPSQTKKIQIKHIKMKQCTIYDSKIIKCKIYHSSIYNSKISFSTLKYISIYESIVRLSKLFMIQHVQGIKQVNKYTKFIQCEIESIQAQYNKDYTLWYTVFDKCKFNITTLNLNIKKLVIKQFDSMIIDTDKINGQWQKYNQIFNTTISNETMQQLNEKLKEQK